MRYKRINFVRRFFRPNGYLLKDSQCSNGNHVEAGQCPNENIRAAHLTVSKRTSLRNAERKLCKKFCNL